METNSYISTFTVIGSILVTLFLLATSIYLYIRLKKAEAYKNDTECKLKSLENNINALQLEALESKLHPHLFKNILNSVQSHAYQTYFALDKLSNVLDYILYESRKGLVSVKEEIDFCLNLIEINKIKLSPLFELKVKVKTNENDPLLEQRLLAPMVCIDLIENAFKHADIQSPDAFISVTFGLNDGKFLLTVANKVSSKPAIHKQKSGLGTSMTDQRLKLIYENNYSIDRFVENDVYIAHLKINLLEHKAKMLAARR